MNRTHNIQKSRNNWESKPVYYQPKQVSKQYNKKHSYYEWIVLSRTRFISIKCISKLIIKELDKCKKKELQLTFFIMLEHVSRNHSYKKNYDSKNYKCNSDICYRTINILSLYKWNMESFESFSVTCCH